jgi:ubiquinone/menaquinone biosynthesis C-methylase UbiE
MTNPHPQRFLDLLPASGGRALDVGSGGRKLPGVVSVEYVHAPGADLRADGAHLPFPDATFAVALSQAVLEHVPDPQAHVDELYRVLKPGGLLWLELAFLQPVHMAPWHYFNITPHGLDLLLGRWEVLERSTIGGMAELWEWVARDVRADRFLPAEEIRRVAESMRTVTDRLSPAEAQSCACGLGVLARRPAVLQ